MADTSDLQVRKGTELLCLEEALTCEGKLYISLESDELVTEDVEPFIGLLIDEQEALEIIAHLIKVFQLEEKSSGNSKDTN